MYNNDIQSKEYYRLRNYIIDIHSGEDVHYNLEKLSAHVQELYDEGKLKTTQYDDLMRYLYDLE